MLAIYPHLVLKQEQMATASFKPLFDGTICVDDKFKNKSQ